MKIRITFGILAMIAVLWLPWWVAILPSVILVARWRAWEVVAIALFADLLYAPLDGFWYVPLPLTFAALILIFVFEPLRKRWMVQG